MTSLKYFIICLQTYDSPGSPDNEGAFKTETAEFKLPELPAPRNKSVKYVESKLSISPIEIIAALPRRSLRLSLKQVDNHHDNFAHLQSFRNSVIDETLSNNSIAKLNNSTSLSNRRKSVRLALKMNATKNQESHCNNLNDKKRKARLDVKSTPAGKRIMTKNR